MRDSYLVHQHIQNLFIKSMHIYQSILVVFLLLVGLGHSFGEQEELFIRNNIEWTLGRNHLSGQRWGMNYHFYRPGLRKYGPNQWLWDSCFHMIAWSRINITNSILDLRTMFQKQVEKNGRVPEMIYWGQQSRRDSMMNKFFLSDPSQTDITQMPMIPIALKRIYQQTNKSKQILQQFLTKLIRYHEWWANERQPEKDGLVVIIHPWESGLDASPMYDEALKVESDQPKLKEMYSRFIELQLSYKHVYKWKQRKIVAPKAHSPSSVFLDYFVIKEVGVNAIYTYGWKILENLSRQLGDKELQSKCNKNYKHFLKGLISLYDEEKGRYVSHYLDGAEYKKTKKNTVQSLFPLIVPDIPQKHRDGILAMLRDEKHYKSDYPIPTVSRSDPAYNPIYTINLMWRGPSWAAPNYFILEALLNLGEIDLYKEIANKWVSTVYKNEVWEMWNPETGQGYGVQYLGMSTCVIDVMFKLKALG